jgi:hypothetical protein
MPGPVPYSGLQGQPQAPGTIIPDDYQHIQANPADFGGQIGQALGGTAQAANQVGQAAQQIQAQTDQAASSSGFIKYDQALNQIGHGDPNNPNDTGYFGKQGAAAVNSYADTMAQAETVRQQIRASLPSGPAQLQFDQDSRRALMFFNSQAGDFKTRQQQVYQGQTQDALIASDKSSAIIDPFNDQQFLAKTGDLQNAVLQKASQQGWSPETTTQQLAAHTSDVFKLRAQAMAETDPTAAWNFYLQAHGRFTGTDALDVERQLDPRILAQQAPIYGKKLMAGQPVPGVGSMVGDPAMAPTAMASIPDQGTRSMAISAANAAMLPAAAVSAWISAVHNESQWNPAEKDGNDGEIGIGQVMPATGAQYGYTPQQLRDPATNLVASARIFAAQWQASHGDVAGALRGYNGGNPGVMAAQGYADRAMQRMSGWAPAGAAPAGAPASAPPLTSASAAAAPATAAQPPAPERAISPCNDPNQPAPPSVAAPPGGGSAPGGPVPTPTPDSPHDTPAATLAGGAPAGDAVGAPGGSRPSLAHADERFPPASAAAAAGGTPSAPTPTAALAPPTSTDPRDHVQGWLQQADQVLDYRGRSNPAFQAQVASYVRQRVGEMEYGQAQTDRANRDALLSAAIGLPAGAGAATPAPGAAPGGLPASDGSTVIPATAGGQAAGTTGMPTMGPKPTSIDQLLSTPALRSAWASSTPEMQRSLLGVLEQNSKGADPPENDAALTAYYKLRGMAAENPGDFKSTDLSAPSVLSMMPHHLLLDLMNRQASISTNDAKAAQTGINILHAQTVTLPDARQAGLNPASKPGTPAADSWAQYTGRLDDALQRFQSDNNRRPNDDETKKIGQSLLTQGWLHGTGSLWGALPNDTPTHLFEAQTSGKVGQFYPNVPASDRAQITSSFQTQYGRPPSAAEVQQVFMLRRQPMTGQRSGSPTRPAASGAAQPSAPTSGAAPVPAAAPNTMAQQDNAPAGMDQAVGGF